MGKEQVKKLFEELPKHLQTPLRFESIDFSEDMKALSDALREVNSMSTLRDVDNLDLEITRAKILEAMQEVSKAITILHKSRVHLELR